MNNNNSNEKLSLDEARKYVRTHLKIENFEEKVKANGLAALNEFIRTTQATYPFQNIDLMATPAHLRRVPTYSDMKKSYFNGKGGLCMVLNPFSCLVLQQFGYKAYLASATLPEALYPDNHALIIVKDLVETGDLFLVEVGCSYPGFQAIPLNGPNANKIYLDSFLQYTVIKIDETWYGRYHLKGDPKEVILPNGEIIKPNTKRLFYKFTLEPKSDEFFEKSMYKTFTKSDESPHIRNLLVSYCPPGKTYTLKGNLFRKFDEETGVLTTRILKTLDEFKEVFHKEMKMPAVDDKELERAVNLYFQINPQN